MVQDRGRRRGKGFYVLLVTIFLTDCAGFQIRDGTYINKAKGFAVPLPPNGWSVEIDEEADLVLLHQSRRAGMVVNATCGEIPPDRPLPIISRHLFFGIDGKEIVQEPRTTAHGEVLEVVLRGEVDGWEFLLHGYTLKEWSCVYDLVLFAPPEDYPEMNREFQTLFGRFQLLGVEAR